MTEPRPRPPREGLPADPPRGPCGGVPEPDAPAWPREPPAAAPTGMTSTAEVALDDRRSDRDMALASVAAAAPRWAGMEAVIAASESGSAD